MLLAESNSLCSDRRKAASVKRGQVYASTTSCQSADAMTSYHHPLELMNVAALFPSILHVVNRRRITDDLSQFYPKYVSTVPNGVFVIYWVYRIRWSRRGHTPELKPLLLRSPCAVAHAMCRAACYRPETCDNYIDPDGYIGLEPWSIRIAVYFCHIDLFGFMLTSSSIFGLLTWS